VPMLRRGSTVKSFREKCEIVHNYLLPSKLTRGEQQKVLMVAIELLYKDLKVSIPVTGRVLMRHFDRIPAIFEHSFPYYAQGGLLKRLASATIKE
jgi:hypothetical protein